MRSTSGSVHGPNDPNSAIRGAALQTETSPLPRLTGPIRCSDWFCDRVLPKSNRSQGREGNTSRPGCGVVRHYPARTTRRPPRQALSYLACPPCLGQPDRTARSYRDSASGVGHGGSIESNLPTSEPATIAAPIGAAPAVVEVLAVEIEAATALQVRISLPVVALSVPLLVPASVVEPVEVKTRSKTRHTRKPALVAACATARPAAVEDKTARLIAEAEAALEEGKAFLARRAEAKAKEAQDLDSMGVARLRQLAARCGHRGTRTMRKDALLVLLAS